MNRVAGAVGALLLCLSCCRLAVAQVSPEEELKTLRVAPEFDVALYASEPLITNPAAIDIDTHGRVWVAEIQFYRGGAKNPPADKIKVLEDTDGDGRADRATVFADGVFCPMSICVAGTRVFVATSPDLWMYEDKDGDLKADGPPTKLLTGFGGQNHDHGAHSLVLGPDHKWWMSHGDAGFDVRGTDGSQVKYRHGAVLRGELDGSRLETVAVNFRNPYEVCVNSFGEAFLSDNDNDGNESVRICWILEGGNYGWFGGPPFARHQLKAQVAANVPFREHWHFRGHIPGNVPGTLITGFGSPCGICIYESDACGPKYKNAPLHADAGPRECRAYPHEPAGFGMKATSEVFLSNQGDNYFRPDDVCVAPDGSLLVSDWYDGGVGGHGYNNPNQGRIFRLTPKGRTLARSDKPGPYTNTADAIEGLKSPNLATQFLARERLLADGQQSVPALEGLLKDPEPNNRARALWVLDRIGGPAREIVASQLQAGEPEFRALAVRILRRHGADYEAVILPLAEDASAEVRREVLLAIAKLKGDQADAALATIAATYDGSDRYQLEAIHIAAGERKQALLARLREKGPLAINKFPLVQLLDPRQATETLLAKLKESNLDEKSTRLVLESAGSIPAVEAGWGVLGLAQNGALPAELRKQALAKVESNVDHRGSWTALLEDEKFAKALATLLQDPAMRAATLATIDALRVSALGDDVLAIARDATVPVAERRQAIPVAAHLRPAQAVAAFRQMLADPAVAEAAVRGLVGVQDITSLREVFSGQQFSADVRRKAVRELVEDPGGAVLLFRLLNEDRLPAELKEIVLARATNHADANIRVLYEKFVPESERPKKLGAAISADEILSLAGDANRGRTIFFKSSAAQCKQCHAVQGFGGTLGPELSKIGQKYERRALLETILEPSKAIAPEYIAHLLETKSGQVYAGFVVERTADHVLLKDVKNNTVRVTTDDVETIEPQQKSLMPELVLSEVTAQDAADLLAFLTTLK